MLTNAEVLSHIRNVHAQGLRNYEYSGHKGAKLRPLRTVIEELHLYFHQTGLAKEPSLPEYASKFQARAPTRYPHAPDGAPPPADPSILASHGDERIPLEATVDLAPPDGVLLPTIPAGPRMQRYDATESLLPLRASAAANGGRAPAEVAARQHFWDPGQTLYAPPLGEEELDDRACVAFVPEAVQVCKDAASGRAALTMAEMLNVCNLMPGSAVELELLVEEIEERVGGAEGVAAFAERLMGVWIKYGLKELAEE